MAAVDEFQAALETLAARTQTEVQGTTDAALIVGAINRANAEARSLADLYVVAQLEELTGEPAVVSGPAAVDDSERLTKAVETIMNDPEGFRLDRLAQNEPLEAAQRAAGEALSKHKARSGHLGWVRQLNADACELCRWWAKDGRVWPAKYPMTRHTNCACVQRIVITDSRPKAVRQKRNKRNG